MENRVENGHRANFRPILEFGVPLGFNGLNHIYYILMEYLSVFLGYYSLDVSSNFEFMVISRIYLSTLVMDPMRSLGKNYGRSGVGWGGSDIFQSQFIQLMVIYSHLLTHL